MRDLPPSNSGVLAGRGATILAAVLEEYFATGAPVGSRALAENREDSLSPATIRHVLADLEQCGYLRQPHTSAGRVPTAEAIRWWLKQIEAPAVIPAEQAQRLERLLLEANDETKLWLRVSEFLAEATHQVGLVAVQPWRDAGLRELRFFRLTDRRVLAILVATDGQVRERVSRLPEDYTQPELDTAARYFNHHFAGATMSHIRREMLRRLEEERAAYDELLKRVLVLSQCGALQMEDSGAVYFHGADRLAEMLDSQQLGEMLLRLNEKERWLNLLSGIGVSDKELLEWDMGAAGLGLRHSVRVRVGLDEEQMPDFSLISTPYRKGAVGILGPTRMEYRRALGAVALVRELFSRVLGDYPV